jgi:hypothetical protein
MRTVKKNAILGSMDGDLKNFEELLGLMSFGRE